MRKRRGMLWPCLLTALALLLPVVLTAPTAEAAPSVRYVAPGGSGGEDCSGGTLSRPWGSLERALGCLRPGDVLYVRGGTYTERVHLKRGVAAGRADAPILVAAYPGEQPLIRGYLRITAPDHWDIVGLDITNDGKSYAAGEYLLKIRGGERWSFAHSEIYDVHAYAAVRIVPAEERAQAAPSHWRFVRNCVHHTRPTHAGYKDHNLYIATGAGAGPGLIEGNIAFSAPNGENLKFADNRFPNENTLVRHNTFHDAAQNVLVYGASKNNRFERNIFGKVTGKSWYPNLRGFDLTGRGNVAVGNVGFGADRFVLTGKDSGGSTTEIAARNNHFPADPRFDRTGRCDGYHPTDSRYRGFGARALKGTSYAGVPLVGDWNGDRVDTPGWYEDGEVRLRNRHGAGPADIRFHYGRAGDLPLVGDWDGDGRDTIGIVRAGGEWHLRNQHAGGTADHQFVYGRVGARGHDLPLVGDWDGDGKDTIGIVRDGEWHLRHSLSGGPAQKRFTYGRIGPRGDDLPLVGDWNGDRKDTVGIVRDGEWHLRNSLSGGPGDVQFTYGRVTRGDIPRAGDWNDDGRDGPGVIRDGVSWFLRDERSAGGADHAYVFVR